MRLRAEPLGRTLVQAGRALTDLQIPPPLRCRRAPVETQMPALVLGLILESGTPGPRLALGQALVLVLALAQVRCLRPV